MQKEIIQQLQKNFEDSYQQKDGVEYWLARELQELLEERIAIQERINARKKFSETEVKFSKIVFERGVDGQGFARIRSRGVTCGRRYWQIGKKAEK